MAEFNDFDATPTQLPSPTDNLAALLLNFDEFNFEDEIVITTNASFQYLAILLFD